MNRRVLFVALLATLLIRLLAWGAVGRGTVYAQTGELRLKLEPSPCWVSVDGREREVKERIFKANLPLG